MPSVGETRTVLCPADCGEGAWSFDIEVDCPSGCPSDGYTYSESTHVATWSGSDAIGTGQACPADKEVTCPGYTCCEYGTESAYGTCGQHESGQQLYRKYATNAPCTGDTYRQSKTPCAPCTGGTWSYTCPTYCGYGGGQVTATLTGYTPAVGTGADCTTSKQVDCDSTPACPPCEYTPWQYFGGCRSESISNVKGNVIYGVKQKKQTFTRTKTNSPCVRESPDTEKSENCSDCEFGWVHDGTYTYTYDNPRSECSWGGGKCYCSYYKNMYWGVTTPAVNTSCNQWQVGAKTELAGEWECGMNNCPTKCYVAHAGAR